MGQWVSVVPALAFAADLPVFRSRRCGTAIGADQPWQTGRPVCSRAGRGAGSIRSTATPLPGDGHDLALIRHDHLFTTRQALPARPLMQTPLLLFVPSLFAALALRPLPGEAAASAFLLAAVISLAAFLLLLKAWAGQRLRRRLPSRQACVVVDGSNVMFWQDGVPRLATVAAVVGEVHRAGLTPIVWFDANVGFRVGDHYMGTRDLSRALGLPRGQVRIAPSGTPADPLLLKEAAELGTGVITNDMYRDWVAAFPSLRQPGVLVPGRVSDGVVRLDWAA